MFYSFHTPLGKWINIIIKWDISPLFVDATIKITTTALEHAFRILIEGAGYDKSHRDPLYERLI